MQRVTARSAAHRPLAGMQREAVDRVGYRVGILPDVVLERSAGKVRNGEVPEIQRWLPAIEELERHVLEPVGMHVSRRVESPQMPVEVPPFVPGLVLTLVLATFPPARAPAPPPHH